MQAHQGWDYHTEYHATLRGGERSSSVITLVIIHCTDGGTTAKGNAAYFASGNAGGSTQLVIDDKECYRCLPDNVVPAGAPGANSQGVHTEIVGFSAWNREKWMEHRKRIDHAAWHAARWCFKYDIPPRWRGWLGLRLGRQGISSHANVSMAWHRTDHTDPGKGFPKDWFMQRVKHHYAGFQKARHSHG